MAKVKFRKEDLEEIGSFEEMERVAFGEERNRNRKGSRRDSGSIPRK